MAEGIKQNMRAARCYFTLVNRVVPSLYSVPLPQWTFKSHCSSRVLSDFQKYLAEMITYFERLYKHHGTAGIVLKLSHLETPPINPYQHHLFQIPCLFFLRNSLNPCLTHVRHNGFELQKWSSKLSGCKIRIFSKKALQGAWPLPLSWFKRGSTFWSVWTIRCVYIIYLYMYINSMKTFPQDKNGKIRRPSPRPTQKHTHKYLDIPSLQNCSWATSSNHQLLGVLHTKLQAPCKSCMNEHCDIPVHPICGFQIGWSLPNHYCLPNVGHSDHHSAIHAEQRQKTHCCSPTSSSAKNK